MMKRPRRRWGMRFAALAGAIALVGGVPIAPAASAAPVACPQAVPLSDVTLGLRGVGYTVARGTDPEPFDVEVLGVVSNPLLPLRDVIIVETSSPTIDRVGGIWAGMSGSPVYVGDKLLGAVAYSLSFGPSRIAGLTAGPDMLEVLDRPASTPLAAGSTPPRVSLSSPLRTRIAGATGVETAAVGGSMVQMKLPLSVSGLTSRGMRGVKHFLSQHHVRAVPFAGTSVSASEVADSSAVQPGGNFAAAISYGDVTYAAIGTTTIVCNGRAVAFGHPFFWEGKTMLGANAARAITVVDDPTFGNYKLAEVEGSIGTVDQDRFAGIRTLLDGAPRTIPVTSRTTSADTGRTLDGETRVVFGQDAIHVSLDHLFLSILAIQDQFGAGSSKMSWTVRGTKQSGGAWQLQRTNMYTSRYGIAYDTLDEYHWQMHRIEDNRFDPVEFTGVHADITVRDEIRQYSVVGVQAATGTRSLRPVQGPLRVRAGGLIRLRVRLEPYEGTADKFVTMAVRVPRSTPAGRATLDIGGGRACSYRCSHKGVSTFAGFLRAEATQDHHNELVAEVYGHKGSELARVKRSLDRVVARRKSIDLVVVR